MLEEKSVKNWLKRKVKFTQALLVAFLITGGVGYAVDNVPGKGAGVAIGTGSEAPKAENVAVGKNATVSYSNGDSKATGDIVVGNDANINNYASQGGSIAIGKNAKIENMAGGAEASFAFGQTTYSGSKYSSPRIPADPTKVPGSIAMGQNTFARTGSTMIGVHNYTGALGDTNVDSSNTRKSNLNVYSTTIGTNSHSNGAFTTLSGAYSIISSNYNGGRLANPVKNLGATVTGSLNSVESYTGNYYSGIANSITGIANKTVNSNGALIYGAGNTISNSVASLTGAPTTSGDSAKKFQDTLIDMIKNNNGGGSTMAFGGGNKADWTQLTSMIGVNNTITGKSGKIAKYNMVNGYKNTVTESSENLVSGTNWSVSGEGKNILMGFNEKENKVEKKNVVALGNDIKVNTDNSVYLGSGSTDAETKATKGMEEYSSATIGKNTFNFAGGKADGIVSVGSTGKERRIQNVAAGLISETSTDAVNGSQLYAVAEEFHNYQNTTNDRMNKMESETHHVGALSASLAALHPMQYDPLQKSQVMAGVGTYRDKQAIAVGVAHYFNENLMMTAGVSLGEDTRTKTMANLGLTWKIGSDDDRKDLPERYKEGPIGSIYMMQTEMEQVMNENKDLKKLTQTQQQEIETMKQQIQMLMEKVK